MLPDISALVRRWLVGAPSAWPLILIVVVLAAAVGYAIAPTPLSPLTPEFAFTNGTDTIQASGALRISGSNVPNATGIFCWFPANSCQLVVAELVPEGKRTRFKIVEKQLDIIQLSDASLTATASSTDPCQVETLRIDRRAEAATLSVGPVNTGCSGVTTFTAKLGG